MNQNFFTILLLGNLNTATTAQQEAFIQLFGQLWLTSTLHLVQKVSATGIRLFTFHNPWDWDLPTDVAGVVEYNRVLNNTMANNKITTIENATVTKGDFVCALSTAVLDKDMNFQQTIDISEITTVADTKIWLGVSNSTLTDAYDPFSNAIARVFFNRDNAQQLRSLTQIAVNNATVNTMALRRPANG